MAASGSFSQSSPIPSTVWSRLQSALGKPLCQRCQEIEELIATSCNKDVASVLPGLLESIFGFGAEPGWDLYQVMKSQHPHEFDALLKLLGPEGSLMTLVYNLQTDVYLSFEFPFSCLPAPTRHLVEEGSLPMFYVNKLQFQSYSKPVMTLSAFELYMFHFAYVLVSPQWQTKSVNWSNMTDVVYPCLLDAYLRHFLPANKKSLPKFPQCHLTQLRSPVIGQQTPVSGKHSPGGGTQTRSRSRLGLFKPNLLSPQKPLNQSSPGAERIEGEIWWSETFIQVLAEFWLNQNSTDSEKGLSPQNLQSPMVMESFLPTNNHVRLARLLLKHVHCFVNSAEPEVGVSPYQTTDVSALDEFKRSLLPSILQKKIYGFMRHSFDRWPLDSSFRLVLETWLTYIQPWRYHDAGPTQKPTDSDLEKVQDAWFPFIRDNFLFYSSLLHEFLSRTRRMHLTSIHNAYMVFRVSKVFSLVNLPQLMREVERMLCGSPYKCGPDLGASYLAPEVNTVLRVQISDLERADFHYVNMFGHDTERQVYGLLHQIDTALTTVSSSTQPVKKAKKSRLASMLDFSSFFEDSVRGYGDMSPGEVKKLVLHLEQGKVNLCRLFSIKPTDVSTVRGGPFGDMNQSQSMYGGNQSLYAGNQSMYGGNQSMTDMQTPVSHHVQHTPDCHNTSWGPELTLVGRYQLMNGLRKFDLSYQGDPDIQPIRSFENSTMVRVLYRVSNFINKLFHREIENLYHRRDLLGRVCQVYFAPPLSPSRIPTSPITPDLVHELQTPRVSLRFLASYQTLLYLVVMYAFLWLGWGVGGVTYVLFLLLCVLVYGLLRALMTPRESVAAS